MTAAPPTAPRRARSVVVILTVLSILLAGLLGVPLAVSTLSAAQAAAGPVKTADLSKFQAGNIISDAAFFNKGTMNEAQIQSFLESKVPSCQAGYTCLKDWYDTSRSTSTDAMCGAYSGGYRERASAIIYKVAQACGINPQVLIVTLQKEQGLVLHTWPSTWRYTIAMGQGCPDTAACDTRYYGFFNQVYGAAWQFKRYANPPGTSNYFNWYAPGRTWNVLYSPNTACGSSPVYIQNQATANLYYYTPYQPNAASLRAGYGTGDSCSTYGNRNFYNYFTDWFGSTSRGVCDQPPYAEVAPASGTFAIGNDVTARQTAYVECDAGSVFVDKGVRVTVSAVWRNWSWVSVNEQMLWVPTSYLVPWDPCAQPPYAQVRAASGTYETASSVTARQTAFVECDKGTVPLEPGVVVTVAAVWANWSWINVNGQMLWVPTSYLKPYVPCTQPPYSEVRPASGTMSTGSGAVLRQTASDDCVRGAVEVPAGTAVTLAASYRDWYWVGVGGTMGWMRASSLLSNPCMQPPFAQVSPASGRLTTTTEVNARTAPSTGCATGVVTLPAGTTVTAAAKWGDWIWVEQAGAHYWIHKDYLVTDQVAACVQPSYSQVRNASGTTVLAAGSVARSAPSTDCITGALTVPQQRVVEIGARWNDWYWVKIDGSMYWVPAR